MSISPKSNTTIRSISLPCRSHPNILRIESELKKFKTMEGSSMVPWDHNESLSGMEVLYKYVQDILNLPMTQQALSRCQNEKCIDTLFDGSIRVLEICDILKEIVSQMKEHVRDLQCALRRRKEDSSIEKNIDRFICLRKKITKDAKKMFSNLKRVDYVSGKSVVADIDHDHLVGVVRILMEVSETTILTFITMFQFFSIKPKPSRWSSVSKLMHKGRVSCEQVQGKVNVMESLDAGLVNLCRYGSSDEGQKSKFAHDKLKAMEVYIENTENGLDCLFRNLVKTRALLLNIMSQ